MSVPFTGFRWFSSSILLKQKQAAKDLESSSRHINRCFISGRIRLMSPRGLVLDGGQEIACDVIVSAGLHP